MTKVTGADQLHCVFVDNGLLREGDVLYVRDLYENELHIPLVVLDKSEIFISALDGVENPELKRKIIGALVV